MEDADQKKRLEQFLTDGKDWEKKATNIPGIFILKLPNYQGSFSLALEINPVDSSGFPTKKRGIIIRTSSELDSTRNLLSTENLFALSKNIEAVNSESKTPSANGRSRIIKI